MQKCELEGNIVLTGIKCIYLYTHATARPRGFNVYHARAGANPLYNGAAGQTLIPGLHTLKVHCSEP